MPKITFLPSGVEIEVSAGTTVFSAAARAEVPIPSQCGGKCACALCRVKIVEGDERTAPMTWEEEGHLGNAFFITRERLSCQLKVFGDITVEVSEGEAKEKKKARYIPYSIIRKREQMERDDDQARALGKDKAAGRSGRGRSGGDERGRKPRDRKGPDEPRTAKEGRKRRDGPPRPSGRPTDAPKGPPRPDSGPRKPANRSAGRPLEPSERAALERRRAEEAEASAGGPAAPAAESPPEAKPRGSGAGEKQPAEKRRRRRTRGRGGRGAGPGRSQAATPSGSPPKDS